MMNIVTVHGLSYSVQLRFVQISAYLRYSVRQQHRILVKCELLKGRRQKRKYRTAYLFEPKFGNNQKGVIDLK